VSTNTAGISRSLGFGDRAHRRYWWHRLEGADYVPPIYATLDESEWAIMEAWFEETDELGVSGEANVAFMSLLQGVVMGNAVRRIVQLGTFVGYSSLLLGFMLRRMGVTDGLFTVDIDREKNRFTREYLSRAGLEGHVRVMDGDSADERVADEARAWLGGAPQLVVLDSSHAYRHTLRELDLWFPVLAQGGLLLLHDCSEFAAQFDPTAEGGVQRALRRWTRRHRRGYDHMTIAHRPHGAPATEQAYRDPCGVGLIQKH
jgi:predicted O-methyltransferase YrrM